MVDFRLLFRLAPIPSARWSIFFFSSNVQDFFNRCRFSSEILPVPSILEY
jgi:hypothetical protein